MSQTDEGFEVVELFMILSTLLGALVALVSHRLKFGNFDFAKITKWWHAIITGCWAFLLLVCVLAAAELQLFSIAWPISVNNVLIIAVLAYKLYAYPGRAFDCSDPSNEQ